ncbi:MAG: hypothetical protein IAE66_06485 [Xanthomonadaceae bacterium]|nr:hypothetical protein [Xanthomonadaceae bacterium]
MNRKHLTIALASALVATVGITGCKKKEEAAAPPPAAEAAPTPAPAPVETVAVVAPVTIDAIELGNAVGADNRVTTVSTVFVPTDAIYAAVNTAGAAAPGNKLNVKWTYQDGQTVYTEDRTMDGADTVYAFKIANPKGWPAGKYKVEVSLDGGQLQTREFEVK